MSPKKLNHGQSSATVYRAERETRTLLQRVQQIRALADGEKEALGFLPEAAYSDAIEHGRLVAMIAQVGDSSELAGFILFSGVFPNARVQQIVVSPSHRRAHVASALINEVISQLEEQGYLTITAAVASDLPMAQAFYERNGFEARYSRQGGAARSRTIVLRARDLDTASFFSMLEPSASSTSSAMDLGLMQRIAGHAPLYVIDLNVLFDLVKDRTRAALANRLFGAALAHQIRLAVAPEFLVELERTTTDSGNDPILRLARQLPRLPATDRPETDRLCGIVHHLVFGGQNAVTANSPQSKSDVRHIAQAALARASGYVTSDGRVLASRQHLLEQVGIDVASLNDFVALLPTETPMLNAPHLKGANFDIKPIASDAVARYLSEHRAPQTVISEFAPSNLPAEGRIKARGIIEGGEVVGVGVCLAPEKIDAPARILIHVRTDHVSCETYADHLVDVECWEACEEAPTTIELPELAGQTAVRRAARLRGFFSVGSGDTRIKVALGRPVTFENWPAVARQTRRRTG
jgi:ribosomal protein S18 acetylase RimI-like enzyme